jgi:peptide/nickel transport system permease protein
MSKWNHWLALGWLTAVLLAALLAPTEALSPDLTHISTPPFCYPHWLGTTAQGLDVGLSMWQGARTLLLVSMPAAVLTLLLGAMLGGAAGFWGNTGWRVGWGPTVAAGATGTLLIIAPPLTSSPVVWLVLLGALTGFWALLLARIRRGPTWAVPLDTLISGLITLLNSVPLLVLVVAVAAVQRPSVGGIVALLSFTCWTVPARLMRAATLQISHQPYIEAARAAGIPARRILWRHIGPNALPVLLVRFPLTVALLISLETTLSFLGVGLPPETPSWGRLLAAVRQAPTNWWLILWPGLAIIFTILSLQHLAAIRQHSLHVTKR